MSKGAPKKPSYGPCHEIHGRQWATATYGGFYVTSTPNIVFSTGYYINATTGATRTYNF